MLWVSVLRIADNIRSLVRSAISKSWPVSFAFWSALAMGLSPVLLHLFYWDDFDLVLIGGRDRAWQFFIPGHADVSYHYNPFRLASFVAIRALAGRAPWAYHLLSLALQLACVAAWLRISERLCSSWVVRLPMAAILCFLTLPSEAVFWVGANDQVIGSAAYLWSAWAYMRFIEDGRRHHFWLSLILFCLGVSTIEFVASLPLLLFAISLWPGSLGIERTGEESPSQLLPFFLVLMLYIPLHVLSLDRERLFVTEHYSIEPGIHTIRNLVFAVEKVILGSTYFHKLAPVQALDATHGESCSLMPHVISGLLLIGGLCWRKTRVIVAWLILSLLPYVLRPHPAVESRYYHLPAAVFLLSWLPGFDAITRSRWVRTVLACGLLVFLASLYHTWSTSHYGYYFSIGEEADSELGRILPRAPDAVTTHTSLVVFNQVPGSLVTVTSAVGDSWTDQLGHSVRTRHFCDWDSYRVANRSGGATDEEWHIGLGRVLFGEDGHGDGDSPVCPPLASTAHQSSTEMVWQVKQPFPGFLVWRMAQGVEIGGSSARIRIAIEEYAEDDRVGTQTLRIVELMMDEARGRIRLSRPLHNRNWTKITWSAPDALNSATIDYLALETP